MKKAFVLSMVAIFLFVSLGSAQDKKHEIDLGVGVWTSNQVVGIVSEMIISALPTGMKIENSSYIGALHAGYKYAVSERFALGPVLTYDYGTFDAVNSTEKWKVSSHYSTLTLEADYKYINQNKFKLYSLVGVGGTYLNQVATKTDKKESQTQMFFNFQVTPVGMKYGDSFGVFAELGLGYKGILSAGLFYRF